MIIGLYIAEQPMGSELDTIKRPGLALNRYIEGYVVGTDKIYSVEILRNGKVLKSFNPKADHLDFSFDDMDPLLKIAFKPKDEKPPFIYYYLRAIQDDGHIAWSSPIWIDYVEKEAAPIKKKGKKA